MAKYRVETEAGVFVVETEDAPVAAQPKQPEGRGFFESAWQQINPVPGLKALANDPAGTIRAMGESQDALRAQAADQFSKGNYAEAARAGLNYLVPFVGPGMQQAGDAMERGNYAEGLGTTAGIAANVVGPKVVSGAVKGARAAAPALQQSARTQYSRVMNATKQGNKFLSDKVVPEMLERGVMAPTMKGLQAKVAANAERIGEAIGYEWEQVPAGTKVELAPILSRLEQSAAREMGQMGASGPVRDATGAVVASGPLAETGLQNVAKLAQTLTAGAEADAATGALVIPVERLRALRQTFDGVAARAGRYSGKPLADQAMAEAYGMAADAMRQELTSMRPDLARLNKEYSFWRNAQTVVDETVQRRTGQRTPMSTKLSSVAGAAAGAAVGGDVIGTLVGATAGGMLERVISSPAWGTVSAVAKNRLANALARGNRNAAIAEIHKINRVIRRATANQAAVAAGRK